MLHFSTYNEEVDEDEKDEEDMELILEVAEPL